jgi:hypothetical protein
MKECEGIAFHILASFVGADKTTPINRPLRASELADGLVIVNERSAHPGPDYLLCARARGRCDSRRRRLRLPHVAPRLA